MDESFRQALRDFKVDETDLHAFGRLVVAFWRAGLQDEDKRPLQVMFKLRKLPTSKATAEGRGLQSHPWGKTGRAKKKGRGKRKGAPCYWWSIGPGRWATPDGRAWIMACTETGAQTWWSDNRSKPFASIGELVDYVTGRATEWRVVENEAKERKAS